MPPTNRARPRWQMTLAILAAALLLGALPALGSGTAGALDASFGVDGLAVTYASWNADVTVARQTTGALVMGSRDVTLDADGAVTSSFWRIRRLNIDGSLDASFGSSGEVELFAEHGTYQLNDLVVDASDRILATGRASFEVTTTSGNGKKRKTTTSIIRRLVVVRLTASGAPDTSFGDGGIMAIEIPAATYYGEGIGEALHVLSDGRILVAGNASQVASSSGGGGGGKGKKGGGSPSVSDAIVLIRLTASGSLDSSFGDGGMTIHDATTVDDAVHPGLIAVQSTGRIVLGGGARGGDYDTEGWVLTAYDSDGAEDTAFGRVVVADAMLWGLAVDASDRLVGSGNDGAYFVLIRHAADGSIDTGFGSGGTVTLGVDTMGGQVLIQSDGKIVSAVQMFDASGLVSCSIARFSDGGVLDTGFGLGGFGDEIAESGRSMGLIGGALIDGNGDLVFGGVEFDDARTYAWFVARWCGG